MCFQYSTTARSTLVADSTSFVSGLATTPRAAKPDFLILARPLLSPGVPSPDPPKKAFPRKG